MSQPTAGKRLVDLHPKWISVGANRTGMGVSFDCPVHGERCKLALYFTNPIDGGAPVPITPLSLTRWKRNRDTFEELTLLPSIHILDTGRCPSCGAVGLRWQEAGGHAPHNTPAGLPCPDTQAATHWHGFITDGMVTP